MTPWLEPSSDAKGMSCWIQHDDQAIVAVRLKRRSDGSVPLQVGFHLVWGVDEEVQVHL
jgi:hypothetical protein